VAWVYSGAASKRLRIKAKKGMLVRGKFIKGKKSILGFASVII
jgi:hypothetical protein